VAVVYFFSIWVTVSHCTNTVPWEYYCIITLEKACFEQKCKLELDMSKSFCKYLTTYWNKLPSKSFSFEVKTPFAKKSWCYIRAKSLPHHHNESLSSSFIKKGIMEYYCFILFHGVYYSYKSPFILVYLKYEIPPPRMLGYSLFSKGRDLVLCNFS